MNKYYSNGLSLNPYVVFLQYCLVRTKKKRKKRPEMAQLKHNLIYLDVYVEEYHCDQMIG